MGIMWQRLMLQRLKVQLQSLAPQAVSLQVQLPKGTEQGLRKQALETRVNGLPAAFFTGISRQDMLRSVSGNSVKQAVSMKAGLIEFWCLESVASRQKAVNSRVPSSNASKLSDGVIQLNSDAAKYRSPTQGLHWTLQSSCRGTTTPEPTLRHSKRFLQTTLSDTPKNPLLGFAANPSLTLPQTYSLRKFHHKVSLPLSQSFSTHPFKPTQCGHSKLGPFTIRALSTSRGFKSDARRRLAEESVRKASATSKNMLLYLFALTVAMVGATYSAVPLYRMFCQATGFGGTVQKKETVEEKIARHGTTEKKTAPARQITVQFNADVADGMPWKFTPCQREVKVVPGQSTLAFYTAHNLSDKAITGVSTYNVSPMRAGIFFNKIQCFCFEEQRLRPGEKVDMPVFFYIDPEFAEDVKMKGINLLTLSYTFFKVEEDE